MSNTLSSVGKKFELGNEKGNVKLRSISHLVNILYNIICIVGTSNTLCQFTAQYDGFRCGDILLLNIKVVLDTVTKHNGTLSVNEFFEGVKHFMYNKDEITKKRKEVITIMQEVCEEYKR